MDVAVLSEAVTQIGFPAAVCFALLWSNRKTVEHYERVLFEFKLTLDKNTEAMANNTNAMSILSTRINLSQRG